MMNDKLVTMDLLDMRVQVKDSICIATKEFNKIWSSQTVHNN